MALRETPQLRLVAVAAHVAALVVFLLAVMQFTAGVQKRKWPVFPLSGGGGGVRLVDRASSGWAIRIAALGDCGSGIDHLPVGGLVTVARRRQRTEAMVRGCWREDFLSTH